MNTNFLEKVRNIQLEILDEVVKVCQKYNINYFLCSGTLLGAIRHKGFIPWDDDIDIAMNQKDYYNFIEIAKKELSEKFEIDCYTTNPKCSFSFTKVRKKNTVYIEKKEGLKAGNYNKKGIWIDIFCYNNAYNDMQNNNKIFQKCRRIFTFINIKLKTNYYNASFYKKIIYKIFLKLVTIKYLTNKLIKITTENKDNDSEFMCNFGGNLSFEKETIKREQIYPLSVVEFCGKKYNAPKNPDYYLKHLYGNYLKLPPKNKRITHIPSYIKFENGEEIYF